jgi:HEAT repeat protein
MSDLEHWLSGGDLTSDGASDQVVEFVRQQPELIPDVVAGLEVDDDVVRGRAADALEKLGRSQPEALVDDLDLFLLKAVKDPVPMVRWHLAMLLGHLSMYPQHRGAITSVLMVLLDDSSVFTQSWAIVSLCIVGRQDPHVVDQALPGIVRLAQSPSAAIRTKVRKAIPLLEDPKRAFPKGWVKSNHLSDL